MIEALNKDITASVEDIDAAVRSAVADFVKDTAGTAIPRARHRFRLLTGREICIMSLNLICLCGKAFLNSNFYAD